MPFNYPLLFSTFTRISKKHIPFVRTMNISSRISELRKQRKLSQAELGEKAGVSREIVGRYERGEVMPSIEVAKRMADALGVSLDYLAGEGTTATFDRQTLRLLQEMEQLAPDVREKLLFLANAVIRDYKAGRTYGSH